MSRFSFAFEEQERKAWLLRVSMIGVGLGTGFFILATALTEPFYITSSSIPWLNFILLAVLIWLSRHGKERLASVLLVVGIFMTLAASAYLFGGIRSPGFNGLITVAVLAGVLINFRAGVGFASLGIFYGVFLLIFEQSGMLPSVPFPYPLVLFLITQTAYTIGSIAAIYLAIKSFRVAIDRAQREIRSRLSVEQALRESEARYKAILADQTELIIRVLPDGTILYANESMAHYFGRTGDELIDLNLKEFIHNPEHFDTFEDLTLLTPEEGPKTVEFRIQSPNGESYWQEWAINVVHTEGDEKIELQGVGRDITLRKRAEERQNYNSKLNQLLAQISTSFIASSDGGFDSLVQEMLGKVGEFFDLDRCNLWLNSDIPKMFNLHHQWFTEGLEPINLTSIRPDHFPWISRQLVNGEIVHIEDTAKLPPGAEAERVLLLQLGIRSVIQIPIISSGKSYGIFSLDYDSSRNEIPKQALPIIKIIGEIFIHAVIRQESVTAVRKSEAHKSLVLNSAPMAFYIANPNGHYGGTWVSDQIDRLTGFSPDKFTEPNFWASRLHPEDLDRAIAAFDTIAEVRSVDIEYRWQVANGEYHWFSDHAVLGQRENGKADEIIGTWTDITAHKQADEDLILSEERFRKVAQTAGDGIILTDGQGKIIFWNQAATEIFMYTEEEVLGQPYVTLLPLESREMHEVSWNHRRAEISGQSSFKRIEGMGLRKDGEQFPMELSIASWGSNGDLYFCIIIQDIAEKQEAMRRTINQERLAAVGQMAAGIAHDFNNALMPITLYADLLLHEMELSPGVKDMLEIMQSQAQHAADLTKQVLDFSHQSVMDSRRFNIVSFLESMCDFLRRTLPETIKIKLESDLGAEYIKGDPGRLKQAVLNLALNARDAMLDGGELTFTISSHTYTPENTPLDQINVGQWIRMVVSDTGSGIPSENLARIFEPFFTTKEDMGGTGLGLAQVYGIVSQHDGFIDVESEVNLGTSFHIYLPLANQKSTSKPDPNHQLPKSGCKESILIVEDDRAVRKSLCDIFETLNYNVFTAQTGGEAIVTYLENPIDIVMSDVVLPDMDGVELYESIRIRDPNLKMVVMSGYPMMGRGKKLVDAGAMAWAQKPMDFEKTSRVVFDILNETGRGSQGEEPYAC